MPSTWHCSRLPGVISCGWTQTLEGSRHLSSNRRAAHRTFGASIPFTVGTTLLHAAGTDPAAFALAETPEGTLRCPAANICAQRSRLPPSAFRQSQVMQARYRGSIDCGNRGSVGTYCVHPVATNGGAVMDELRAITTFIRAAQSGSISGAARALGLTPQAASKHILNLEEWAGVRLLNRTTHKISLTEEGLAFYERCKPAVESIEEGLVGLRDATEDPVGAVRLAVPYGILRLVGPLMGRFLDQYPRVSIYLIAYDKTPDVVQERIDVGIQGGALPDSSLVARKFASVQLVPCATPAYLKKYGIPKTMEDLRSHRCIKLRVLDSGIALPWTFRKGDEVVTFDVPASISTNDIEVELQAVLSGAGIGQLTSFRIASHIRAKRLRALLIDYVSENYGLYVYMPRRTFIPKKNRVLADFLYEELKRHPDLQPCKLS